MAQSREFVLELFRQGIECGHVSPEIARLTGHERNRAAKAYHKAWQDIKQQTAVLKEVNQAPLVSLTGTTAAELERAAHSYLREIEIEAHARLASNQKTKPAGTFPLDSLAQREWRVRKLHSKLAAAAAVRKMKGEVVCPDLRAAPPPVIFKDDEQKRREPQRVTIKGMALALLTPRFRVVEITKGVPGQGRFSCVARFDPDEFTDKDKQKMADLFAACKCKNVVAFQKGDDSTFLSTMIAYTRLPSVLSADYGFLELHDLHPGCYARASVHPIAKLSCLGLNHLQKLSDGDVADGERQAYAELYSRKMIQDL